MKRIVYVISTLKRTGPTNVLAGIIKHLDRKQFKPIVITLSPEAEQCYSRKNELKSWGVDIYSLNLSRIQGVFARRKLSVLLDKLQPALIHTHCFRSTVLVEKYAAKYPVVATVHCDFEVDFAMAYGKIVGQIMSVLYKRALNQFSKRICCSNLLADILNKKYPAMHFDYVDNGVDTERFFPLSEEEKQKMRKKLGIPLNKKVFIWAGSFIPIKDPVTMVKAILSLPENKYFFVFCGARGALLAVCQKMLENRKDVMFTGYATNIEQYLQASDVYVSTSLSEGLPLTLLESAFCGLGVLLSAIPQHKYIIGLSKKSFFQVGDYEKLASLISANDRFFYADKNLIEKFSAKNMALKYGELYA